MTTEEYKDLRNRIVEAMKMSGKMLVEEKKRLGQKLVVSRNGVIQFIDPKDIKD